MKKGFTLIELLISVGLLAIFLVVLSQVLYTVLDAHISAISVSVLEQDARYIISRMHYDTTLANYTYVNPNLSRLGIRLNGPDTQIADFSISQIESTTKINFTLTAGGQSRSYQTTIGIR